VKQHVVDGAPIDESDFAGDPPLLLAAGNGHTSVVKYLLSEGADIEQLGPVRFQTSSFFHISMILPS
jgi:ankyrin repeat protein